MTAPQGVGYADITDLAKDLAKSGQDVTQVAKGLVQATTDQVEQYAQQYAPKRTGALAQSISSELLNNGLTGVVTAKAKYALFVELGTGTRGEFPTHEIVIRPVNAKALRWVDASGKVHFAKVVRSPGMKARPFLRPALEKAIDDLENGLGVAITMSILKGKT